jgi:hypothetical protein
MVSRVMYMFGGNRLMILGTMVNVSRLPEARLRTTKSIPAPSVTGVSVSLVMQLGPSLRISRPGKMRFKVYPSSQTRK